MNAPYDVFWCLLCSGIIVLTEPERPNYKYEECLADAVVTDVYALAQRVKKIDITRSVAFLHNGNIHYLERFFDINPDAINTFENREALSRMQPRRACL